MQTYTHFRTVFDVSPADTTEKPWLALIGEIRAWISRKENDPLKGFFFKGGNWSGRAPGRARVTTRALYDGESSKIPEMWAVRYEHTDTAFRSRLWTTNIAVTQVNKREWRLAIQLSHRLRPGYVGKEPAAPEPSSPRLITGLLESKNWFACVGSVRLVSKSQMLSVGKANQFVQLLTDPQRLVPVVLVSCDRKSGVPTLDASLLSRALAGTAVVYFCESSECDLELTHFLPMSFRSPNGMVRIYAPGVDFAQEWTSAKHRFFMGTDIEKQGDDEIIGQIVRALTRSDGWRGVQASVTSIDDIDARARERRLAELRNLSTSSAKDQQELLDLYISENEALTVEIRKRRQELEAEATKRREAEDGLARRNYDLKQAGVSVEEAKAEALGAKEALRAVCDLSEWPNNVKGVAELAVKLGGGRLVLTDAARRSLDKSAFARCAEASPVIWQCLRAMANDLHDLVSQNLQAQQIADEFRKRSKFELTWTEGKQTNKDGKFAKLRKISHGGRNVDITPHVKWDNKTQYLRVHFFVEHDEKAETRRIIIGHCGDHLDTYGTRRRR